MPQRALGRKGGRGPRRGLTSPRPIASFRAPRLPRAVRRKDRMRTYLSFETAVADIDARLDELRAVAEKGDSPALTEEITKLGGTCLLAQAPRDRPHQAGRSKHR